MKIQPPLPCRSSTVRPPGPTTCGLLLAAWGLLLLFGCGDSGPEMVPVRGKVTFGGGDWPKPGILYFNIDRPAEGLPGRPAMGRFGTDGHLTVSTFSEGDGLIPGYYKIGVECWEVPPSMDSPKAAKSYVPDSYPSAAASGLEVTVVRGQSVVEVDFDIPKR